MSWRDEINSNKSQKKTLQILRTRSKAKKARILCDERKQKAKTKQNKVDRERKCWTN